MGRRPFRRNKDFGGDGQQQSYNNRSRSPSHRQDSGRYNDRTSKFNRFSPERSQRYGDRDNSRGNRNSFLSICGKFNNGGNSNNNSYNNMNSSNFNRPNSIGNNFSNGLTYRPMSLNTGISDEYLAREISNIRNSNSNMMGSYQSDGFSSSRTSFNSNFGSSISNYSSNFGNGLSNPYNNDGLDRIRNNRDIRDDIRPSLHSSSGRTDPFKPRSNHSSFFTPDVDSGFSRESNWSRSRDSRDDYRPSIRSRDRKRRRSPSFERDRESVGSRTQVVVDLVKSVMNSVEPGLIESLVDELSSTQEVKERIPSRKYRPHATKDTSFKSRTLKKDSASSDLRAHLNLKKRLGSVKPVRSRLDMGEHTHYAMEKGKGRMRKTKDPGQIKGVIDWISLSKMTDQTLSKNGRKLKIEQIFEKLPSIIPADALKCIICREDTFENHEEFVKHLRSTQHTKKIGFFWDRRNALLETQQCTSKLFGMKEYHVKKGQMSKMNLNTLYCSRCDCNLVFPKSHHNRNAMHKILIEEKCCEKFFQTEQHLITIPHLLKIKKEVGTEIPEETSKEINLEEEFMQYNPIHTYGIGYMMANLNIKCDICNEDIIQDNIADHCKTKDHYDNWHKMEKKQKDDKQKIADVKSEKNLWEDDALLNMCLDDMETIDTWLVNPKGNDEQDDKIKEEKKIKIEENQDETNDEDTQHSTDNEDNTSDNEENTLDNEENTFDKDDNSNHDEEKEDDEEEEEEEECVIEEIGEKM